MADNEANNEADKASQSEKQAVPGSLSQQLMRVVFGLYCLVALVVTSVHMVQEYRHTHEAVQRELASYQQIFGSVLTRAMWDLDRDRLTDIADGLLQVPIITGVSIDRLRQGKAQAMVHRGTVIYKDEVQMVDGAGNLQTIGQEPGTLLVHRFPIVFDVEDTQINLGTATLYSSSDVVFERVRLGFTFLIVNALIKGVALWMIFLWVSKRMLLRPLARLTQSLKKLHFDKLEDCEIDLDLKQRNELSVIEESFQKALTALRAAYEEITQLNTGLVQQVEARTQELTEAQTLASASMQAKNDFLGKMSHELRTPMHGVMGMLSLLENEQLSAEQFRKVRLAKASAESLLALINDVLDFSRMESNRLVLEQHDFDLVRLVSELSEQNAWRAEEKNIEVVLDLAELNHHWLFGDAGRLRQILEILIDNAIKFTDSGHIMLSAASRDVGARVMLTLSLEDTGIGIAPLHVQDIFSPFMQVDAGSTRKYGGTGLGLSIAQRLAQLMQGDIQLHSVPGKGSRFEVCVYLSSSKRDEKLYSSQVLQGRSILLVVDRQASQQALMRQLKVWGAEVHNLSTILLERSPSERIEAIIQGHHYDVVLLDTAINNCEVLMALLKHHLRKQNPEWVLLQSSRSFTVSLTDLALDSVSTIAKPATPDDLFRTLVAMGDCDELDSEESLLVEESLLPEHRKIKWPAKTRILVVEDNVVNQHVAKGLLDNLGLPCDMADDGRQAIAQLCANADEPYSLVLMDCQMPVLDGYDTTRAIRNGEAGEAYRDITIVALTANAMEGDKGRCLDMGMNDYLSKPLEPDTLRVTLERWLLPSHVS